MKFGVNFMALTDIPLLVFVISYICFWAQEKGAAGQWGKQLK
jgi:hypothetical protein